MAETFFKHEDTIIPLYSIPVGVEVPDVLTQEKHAFVLQGLNLFQIKSQPMHSILTGVNETDKTFTNLFGESFYKDDMVYLLKNNWKEFAFPTDQFRYIMRYFQEIYNIHGTEAAVLLMLNPSTKAWKTLFVIQCGASGGSVVYARPMIDASKIEDKKDKDLVTKIMKDKEASQYQKEIHAKYRELYKEGFRIYGTIHSHCNFNAFHSGTDDADELDFDGLHITIGNCNSGWSFSSRYMLSRAAFPIDIKEVLGLENIDDIKKDLEEIKVSDDHLKLMIPDLLEEEEFAVPPTNYQRTNFPNNDSASSAGGFGTFNNWNSSLWDQKDNNWDSNVWMETSVYRVFDWKTGEIMYVKVGYWKDNQDSFPNHTIIPDGPIPDEVAIRHEKFLKENAEPKSNYEKSQRYNNDLTLINHTHLNPNPKNNNTKFKKVSTINNKWYKKAKNLLKGRK